VKRSELFFPLQLPPPLTLLSLSLLFFRAHLPSLSRARETTINQPNETNETMDSTLAFFHAQRGAVAKHAQVRRSATMRASDALFSLSSSNESTFLARARLASPCVFRLFRFSHEILHIKLLFKTRRTS